MGKIRFLSNLSRKSSSKKTNSLRSMVPLPSPPSSSSSSSSTSILPKVQDLDDLRSVFRKFDANGDGKISLSELESVLRCLGSFGSSSAGAEAEAEAMIRAADVDGDGFIGLEEFLSVAAMEIGDRGSWMEDLRGAFMVFDRDGNGLISAEELQHVLAAIGEEASLGDCCAMIDGVDSNGDGAVSFEEFLHMMTKPRV